MWRLWIDDQAKDSIEKRKTPDGFLSALSSEEAKELVRLYGPPAFMSLDHDLGGGDDVVEFLTWLECFINFERNFGDLLAPPDYTIHSENPIGRKRIESFMETWRKGVGKIE